MLPRIVVENLMKPNRDRPGVADVALREVAPQMIRQEGAEVIIWSSIWSKRPTAQVRFDVDGGPSGSELRWTLYDV